jgi:hypothetical protein
MLKYLVIYEEAVSHSVYDFATTPFWIWILFFISVKRKTGNNVPKLKTAGAMEQGKQECREEDQARLRLFPLLTS